MMFQNQQETGSICSSPSRRRTAPRKMPVRILALLCLPLLLLPACTGKKQYQIIEQENTIEAYQSFVDRYKKDKRKKKYIKKANERIEELTFEQVCEEDTYEAYTRYLKEYPAGEYTRTAQQKGEEIRARELDINLYESLPKDYYEKVTTRFLPYRVLVLASDRQGVLTDELETNWYRDLAARDLFVPMDPKQSYPVSPDITIHLRRGVIYLCGRPKAFAEAKVRVKGKEVKTYRVAADRTEKVLLYEIFSDREMYDSLLGISEEEKKAVSEQFELLRQELPKYGSVAFEVDIRQEAYPWDREMTLEWALFLKELKPYETFTTYLRGQPPDSAYQKRVYLRVAPGIHAPYIRSQWSTVGPMKRWNAWNTKWIVTDKDFFFKKLTLDLVAFLEQAPKPAPARKRPESKPIYFR